MSGSSDWRPLILPSWIATGDWSGLALGLATCDWRFVHGSGSGREHGSCIDNAILTGVQVHEYVLKYWYCEYRVHCVLESEW